VTALRIGIATIVAAIGLAAAVCAAGFWLLATERGTDWLAAQARGRAPAAISIGDVDGTLWGGLRLRQVVVNLGGALVRIDDAQLRPDLRGLLRGLVSVGTLDVAAVHYESVVRDTPAAARGPIVLPWRVEVAAASVDELALVLGGRDYVLGPIRFSASVAGSQADIDGLSGAGLGFDVDGRATVRFAAGLEIDSRFRWSTVVNELEYAGEGSVAGDWPELAFDQNVIAPVALRAQGTLDLAASPNVELEASWTDLTWPWLAEAHSSEGRAELSGWLRNYTFNAGGELDVAGIDSRFVASGSGTLETLDFAELDLSNPQGRIAAAGRVDLRPLEWSFDVRTTALDPSMVLVDWPGALDLTGRLSGHTAPILALSLEEATLGGELRGQPVMASGGVSYEAPNVWGFRALDVESNENRLRVDGSLGARLSLDVDVNAAALERVFGDASGAVVLSGHVGGTLDVPELDGRGSADNLSYAGFDVASVSFDGRIVADDARTVGANLTAQAIDWRGFRIDSLSAKIDGTAASHVADLAIDTEYGVGTLSAAGAWADEQWIGTLTELALAEDAIGRWELAAPTALRAGPSAVEIERACLAQGTASLCAAARVGGDDDSLSLQLSAFDFSAIAGLLPTALEISGRYDAEIELAGPLTRPAGTFRATGAGTVIRYREADEPPLDIPIESFEIGGAISEAGGLDVDAIFEGGAAAHVDVAAAVAGLWDDEPEIDARIAGQWADLGMLSLLSPDVGTVSGTGRIDLILGGRLRSPDVRGSARWDGGQIAVPRLGLVVDDVAAEISSEDGTELDIRGSGMVGEGRLDVSGTTRVDAEAGWPTELRVFGEGLQAVRLPEADIIVSPSLQIKAALPRIDVTGAFLIPHARLLLEAPPPQAVQPSPDAVVHGSEQPQRPRPLSMHADIRVGLGDDVRYAGAGLDVALSGAMGLVYESGREATGSGAVKLTGQYQAYGQTLQIEQGQLLFAGPVTNPGLDVRAIRRVDTTTVGVQLTGTVEAPVPRIFSEPAMSEADALSYLLLGRPLSASGDAETATLESAAFAMGLQQALPVIQRVGETLGLDEFSVQTTAADTGELMAGKRLSPRIYIRYTYGLFNRIGGLLMRFNLNDRFSLETRSGDNRSMDLIYTVERD
jgi:translocation and assembly module TamB